MVDTHQQIWQIWARLLHHWGVEGWATSFLESTGSLSWLAAQAVYIGQPVFRLIVPAGHLEALAQVLEDRSQTQAFIRFLREAESS